MKKLVFTLMLSLTPFAVSAQNSKAPYQEFLEHSIFPLQDQVRFYGKNVSAPDSGCHTDTGVNGIYNLTEENGVLSFSCLGTYNATCGSGCFHDGMYLGNYRPEIECAGEIASIGTGEEDSFILEKQICKDEKGETIWERSAGDEYVFDRYDNLIFYKEKHSTAHFRNNTLQHRLYVTSDEIEYYNLNELDTYFHVTYKLNDNGRVIRETHLNRKGFPYFIYDAEYSGNKCTRITRTDVFNHKTKTFEFE